LACVAAQLDEKNRLIVKELMNLTVRTTGTDNAMQLDRNFISFSPAKNTEMRLYHLSPL
jgi:hypothetical protein